MSDCYTQVASIFDQFESSYKLPKTLGFMNMWTGNISIESTELQIYIYIIVASFIPFLSTTPSIAHIPLASADLLFTCFVPQDYLLCFILHPYICIIAQDMSQPGKG